MRTPNNKYPMGYAPKIEYWTNQLANATDITAKFNAMAKLQYFMARQQELESANAPKPSCAFCWNEVDSVNAEGNCSRCE